VIPDDFHVEIANYATDLADLRAVREAVFVQEQRVSPEIELDEIDPQCRHVLARDAQGQAIGTGRLTPAGKIGRMAVLAGWRGRGVGDAMLQTLIDLARTQGHGLVELHAQVDAIGFYERAGFECIGPEYIEAGIRHRSMQRKLDPFPPAGRAPLAPAPESREITIDSLAQTQELALQLVAQGRRHLWIYTRDLDPKLYGQADMLEAIKRFAIEARGGDLRILLQDADAALRDGHALIALAQRLPSRIQIRVPQDEQDRHYAGAFLLDDSGGYLLRPLGSRYEGTGNRHAPGKQRQLRDFFEPVWERSAPDPRLRQLSL
jgi:predicted GNAT family N-acyltransferase